MAGSQFSPISMTIDLKQNRLRIYKTVLYQLGQPKYIQLLVNPARRIIAVRRVDQAVSGDLTHKVNLTSKNSVDISSTSFLNELCGVVGGLDHHFSYRLSGTVLASERIAIFPLQTITRIEEQVH